MEVYIKETLHVLDYKDNVVGTIFNSDDHRTAGYAYNISITEANTGYSDLKFEMPNMILNDQGDLIRNPLQGLMTPLVKLRYRREVYYTGEKPISVREPQGYGDTVVYVNKTYSNTYPDNLIEDYIMDYIVQPVDTKRDVLKTTTTYTAIDYPRFNLSKKRVGLAIGQDTLTKREWSLYENKPMDKPGTIKYIQWNADLSQSAGNPNIPLVWDPENAREYPLQKTDIINLMAHTADWPYGLLATAFYWPITSTARFEGTMYKKGGYLVLQLYDFYNLSTEGIDPELYIDRYSWEWTQLYEVQSYLCPNNALNYLYHILEGTNWSVAMRPDGVTPDVDIVKTTVPNPKGSTESSEEVDLTSNISISNSNCYNAITATCQALQLYPVFDCINRTVALRQFAGKNYGLTYALGKNLKDNSTKADGEKVITKLYCTGGKDYNGDADINIGTAERSYMKTFNGFYNSINDAPTSSVEGYWAIVDPDIPAANFQFKTYELQEVSDVAELVEITITVHDERVADYWVAGENRAVYFWDGTQWNLGTKLPSGNWEGTVAGQTVIVDPETGDSGSWDPNEDMYINSRSPYGTNYILNLKWAYYNKWISKEQILALYQYERQINDLNYAFMDKYTEDYRKTRQLYNEAVNNYDIAQDGYESTLYAMENKYYNVIGEYSQGTVYCFHKAPKGTYTKVSEGAIKNFIKLFHCYGCGLTRAVDNGYLIDPSGNNNDYQLSGTTCPVCGSTDTQSDEIYVPVYDDYKQKDGRNWEDYDSMYPYGTGDTKGGYQYNPHLKGYFQRLVTSLDRSNKQWTIDDYEARVSMIKGMPMKEASVTLDDGYTYKLDGVYVRSTSGQIEVWDEAILNYITNYGKMLDYLRTVNEMLARIRKLDEVYEQWKALVDGLHATIQKNFGDYLVEGNYTNKEQPYINLLFKEGLEASDKYSTPEITYNLNVIDSSGLIEYREPTITKYQCTECDYITNDIIHTCPRCNSEHIDIINDHYNDLVKMLHSTGQIVPKAGDYVAIYDEPMGMFGVPGLITQIARYPDNPVNNKIELNTSYTDDEELVGNIITATNTVLNNSDIYARTAVLKSDGTLDENSIRESLDNSNANISIVGTNGNILLDGSGLRATDPMDPHRAMKYAGNGIFNTTNLENPTGDPVIWEKMMSPAGINATYINSGSIDTNKLTIMSGLAGKVILDQYGLSVKHSTSKANHIGVFDTTEAKKSSSYASDWGTENNLATFVGVDMANNPLVYTKGFLVANEGSNIANWVTSNDGFYHLVSGTTTGQKDIWLSPGGVTGTVNNLGEHNFSLFVNSNFGVDTGGTLYANGANLRGKIVVTDSSSQMNMGTVGGLTSSPDGLSSGDTIILSPTGYDGTVTIKTGVSSSGPWAIYSKGNFGVTTGGTLWAKNGKFGGQIEADSGHIGGWNIDSVQLQKSTGNYSFEIRTDRASNEPALLVYHSSEGYKWYVRPDGHMYASSAEIHGSIYAGSGTIGGWTINSSSISRGNTILGASGTITTKNLNATGGSIGGWTIDGTSGFQGDNAHINPNGNMELYPQNNGGARYLFNSGCKMFATKGVLITDTDSWTTDSDFIAIRASSKNIRIATNQELQLTGKGGSIYSKGDGLLLNSQGLGVYASQAGVVAEANLVVVKGGGTPSSKNVKTNLKTYTKNDYEKIYNEFLDLPLYTYDYKYNNWNAEKDNKGFGFVIDDIEQKDCLNRMLYTYNRFGKITDNNEVVESTKEDYDIKYKTWDVDNTIQMLFVLVKSLQNELEEIKKEKTN